MTAALKTRLFMICTGMLYFGAMLAGMAGYGWGVIAAFVGVFFGWLLLLSPDMFPTTLTGWIRGENVLRNTVRLAVQLALVVFCFALGRGVGGVAGMLPALPLAATLGLSFLALPAARLIGGRTA